MFVSNMAIYGLFTYVCVSLGRLSLDAREWELK